MVGIADYTVQVFFMPVYTRFMYNKYSLSLEESSLYLSLFYVLYFCGLRVMILLTDIFPPKFLMCLALLVNSFGLVFFAPSTAFNINNISYFKFKDNSDKNNLYLSLFGFCFQNFFAGLVCLSAILDMTVSFKKLGYNHYIAGDMASAEYFLAVNISELIGPIIGGVITYKYGFNLTCDVVGAANLLLSIIFMTYNFSRIVRRMISSGSNLNEVEGKNNSSSKDNEEEIYRQESIKIDNLKKSEL